MGICRVPIGKNETDEVYFADGEVIDMPLHINDREDYPDNRDIYIQGNPSFYGTWLWANQDKPIKALINTHP